MRNKHSELSDEKWAEKIIHKWSKANGILSEKIDKTDVPFIKYPDSELPVTGRYLFPVGHHLYHGTIADDVKDCVDRGLLYQGRLWDAYRECDRDTSIVKRRA